MLSTDIGHRSASSALVHNQSWQPTPVDRFVRSLSPWPGAAGLVVKQHPDLVRISTQSPKTQSTRAFSLTELLITVACIALVAAIFLPALARSRARSSRLNCGNNLKQIGLSFCTWSLDNGDHYPMQVSVRTGGTMEMVTNGIVYSHFQVMSNELSTPKVLLCPNDVKRSYATNFDIDLSDRNLSYFVNVAATREDGSGLLCGDRNITNRARAGSRLVSLTKGETIGWTKEIHVERGYLGFSDGRVDSFSNARVGAATKVLEGTTNWLAVP